MCEKNIREKKLYYRSMHRGCKETDILFLRIMNRMLPAENEETLSLLERFCAEDDADVYAWLSAKKGFPEGYPGWFAIALMDSVAL